MDSSARTPVKSLRRGDTVALVACSGPVDADALRSGAATLRSWGLRVRFGATVLGRHPHLDYLAATDSDRARDFERAWLDPGVNAVIAARGGYGAHRMIDLVDWDALRRAEPTVFAGASDATALHAAIATYVGTPTILASMPATAYFDPVAADHLRGALFDPHGTRRLPSAAAETLRPGVAEGRLAGGNLTVLAASVGSAEYRPAVGAVVVLEDIGEEPYRIDRMLTQLLRAGWFDGVAGLAIGSWTDCGGDSDAVRQVLRDRLLPLGVPTVWRLDIGHHPGALAVPLGVRAELDAGTGTLTVTPHT
ncbi:LD-carboxypeptidase [Saccharomonospora xinjiangensis]|uniref:S66 peptidase family protein n=1 Tax=Saccharomonospora xinjiangensis TaxID=75294 RepID=UPI0010C44E4E|nr:LD-carboxypeptidase [Saccharomonospora xinjiangensis]QBQ60476.1 putative murein peptide carboxypeptidase [Saccharomonospora xinjiangensis]